jgi:hypothetical protein
VEFSVGVTIRVSRRRLKLHVVVLWTTNYSRFRHASAGSVTCNPFFMMNKMVALLF